MTTRTIGKYYEHELGEFHAVLEYRWAPEIPATQTDPADGGVEVVKFTVDGNDITDHGSEPFATWLDELIDLAYRDNSE